MTPSWLIDELAHAGPEHLDVEFVRGYDRKQGWPDPSPDIEALRVHGIGPASTVIDMAAGTGRFALAARAVFRTVVAVDVSPAMVANLQAEAGRADRGDLRIVRGGFLSYRHDGPPADGVYTRNALHQLPDFWKVMALRRVAGILRPGGVLRMRDLIYDFAPDETESVFEGWFAHAAGDPAVGYTAEDYAQHIRTEHSTFRWLLEPMLVATGFEIVDVDYGGTKLYGAYTCVRR